MRPAEHESDSPSAALEARGLAAPLRQLTQFTIDEWAVRRMWGHVEARAASGLRSGRTRLGRRGWAVFAAALPALLSALLVFGGFWGHTKASSVQSAVPEVLLTRQARRFESLEAPEDGAPARVEFADGSSIEASAGTRVESLAATPREFVVLLRRGRAHFSVTPGGPRRWLIETRNARVEVVGTVLSVESQDATARVQVEEGSVLVRSPFLPDGVERVSAGQALELRPPTAGATPAADAPSGAIDPPQTEPSRAADSRSSSKSGRPQSAAQLWEQVDRARRAGQPERAAALLKRLLREYPADSQSALAAFTLGVLELDRLGLPGSAAQHFRQAAGSGIPSSLRNDCYLRWARAEQRAGDAEAVRAVARTYANRYPHGTLRSKLERLAAEGADPARGDSAEEGPR
jgi:ferric-dicitrate binding protein FerR (iron transport regulator)